MRCFIACFLLPACARRLQRVLRSSWTAPAGVRLVPAYNYHVTLRFLGSVASADLNRVAAAVTALDGTPTSAVVVAVSGFPRPERAAVVFAELAAGPELPRWHEQLAILPGVDAPGRFVPHVTLARSRRNLVVPRLQALEGMSLQLAAPALYESVPAARGVRYRQVPDASGRLL